MFFGNSGAAMPRSTTSSSSLTPTRGTPARSKVRSLISLRPSSCSNVSLFAGDFYGQPVNFGRDHYLARKSGGGATRGQLVEHIRLIGFGRVDSTDPGIIDKIGRASCRERVCQYV